MPIFNLIHIKKYKLLNLIIQELFNFANKQMTIFPPCLLISKNNQITFNFEKKNAFFLPSCTKKFTLTPNHIILSILSPKLEISL